MQIRTAANEDEVRAATNVWLANRDEPLDIASLERVIAQWLHYYRHDPDGSWMAIDDSSKQIVGIATSLRRPPQWMLVNFYVNPAVHGQGIGHALIDKAISVHAGCDRFLVHASAHPAAHRSYLRAGMYPQPHGMWFEGEPRVPIARPPDVEPIPCDLESALPTINALDKRALGFTRAVDHRWLATSGQYFLLQSESQVIGYFHVSMDGAIGPLVTVSSHWMSDALDVAIIALLEMGQVAHHMLVPGANVAALQKLLRYGYRNVDYEFLFSSRPLSDLASTIFHDCDLL